MSFAGGRPIIRKEFTHDPWRHPLESGYRRENEKSALYPRVLVNIPKDPLYPQRYVVDALQLRGVRIAARDDAKDSRGQHDLPDDFAIHVENKEAVDAYNQCEKFPEVRALYVAARGQPGEYFEKELSDAVAQADTWDENVKRQVNAFYYTRKAAYWRKNLGQSREDLAKEAEQKAKDALTITTEIPTQGLLGRRGKKTLVEHLAPLTETDVQRLVFEAVDQRYHPSAQEE